MTKEKERRKGVGAEREKKGASWLVQKEGNGTSLRQMGLWAGYAKSEQNRKNK
ncbi:MAG: hypothetical protein ACLT0Y_07500 [Christensenellales bacterium]